MAARGSIDGGTWQQRTRHVAAGHLKSVPIRVERRVVVRHPEVKVDRRLVHVRVDAHWVLRGVEDVRPVVHVLERVPVEDAREQLLQLLRRPQQRRRLKAVAVGPDVAGASVEPAPSLSFRSGVSLNLPRACLGKTIAFRIEWREKICACSLPGGRLEAVALRLVQETLCESFPCLSRACLGKINLVTYRNGAKDLQNVFVLPASRPAPPPSGIRPRTCRPSIIRAVECSNVFRGLSLGADIIWIYLIMI